MTDLIRFFRYTSCLHGENGRLNVENGNLQCHLTLDGNHAYPSLTLSYVAQH